MARSRNIKPGLFKNEILGEADPILTILFEGLWCLADREGRLEDRPLRIKAEILPYREGIDINGYLTELERLEFICRYSVENQAIIQVINFLEHQNPHKTEKASKLPPPQKNHVKSDSCTLTVKEPLSNGEVTEDARLIPDSLNLIPDSLIPDSQDYTHTHSAPGFKEYPEIPDPTQKHKKCALPFEKIPCAWKETTEQIWHAHCAAPMIIPDVFRDFRNDALSKNKTSSFWFGNWQTWIVDPVTFKRHEID